MELSNGMARGERNCFFTPPTILSLSLNKDYFPKFALLLAHQIHLDLDVGQG